MKNYKSIICVVAAVCLLGTAAFCGFRIYSHYAHESKQEEVFEKMGLKLSMKDLGITDESHFESMAERAADGLDECQVPLDKDKIVEIYRKCMK